MAVIIDPITGEVSYTDVNGSPTNANNKGSTTATTRNQTTTTTNVSSDKVKDQIIEYIEGVVGLLPNPAYTAKKIFNIDGVGGIFRGNYYFRRVRHTITNDAYTVEADVCKLDNYTLKAISGDQYNNVSTDRAQTPAPPPAPKPPASPKYEMHQIVRGDTLWGLARRYYGNGALYPRIFDANRDTVSDPHWIYDGKWLRIPL
jgi:LysM repeat protein